MLEDIHEILDKVDDNVELAADKIIGGPKKLLRFVLLIGLITIKAKRRATRRRELRRDIQPQYQKGRTTGSIVFTAQSKKKLFEKTNELFGNDGWKIGQLSLGEFTKESLLETAIMEEQSASGHKKNAEFYRALAEPMKPGQRVSEFWTSAKAAEIKKTIWEGQPAP